MPAMLAFLLTLLSSSASGVAVQPSDAKAPPRVVIGYVFVKDRVIAPGEVDATKLTHVNYAFANVKDGRVVEGFAHDADNFRVLTSLRAANPRLKVLVSVGGWTWSKDFSDVSLTEKSRKRFCESAVEFLSRHDLDGLDVDWEYPGLKGDNNPHRPEDGANFTALMRELREHFDRAMEGKPRRWLLTFAAGASPDYLAHTEMGAVHPFVDYVNLMTYDFRVPGSEKEAGHNANLFLNPQDANAQSAESAVRGFLAAGVPPAKLVLGVPFYGRAWEVKGDYGPLYQPGKPASGFGQGSYAVLRELPAQPGWHRLWDDSAQAPWLWNPEKKLFVSYEDPRSLRLKCRLIRERGLGGVMFWEYSEDAGGELLRTLYEELLAAR
jgi:chitinase